MLDAGLCFPVLQTVLCLAICITICCTQGVSMIIGLHSSSLYIVCSCWEAILCLSEALGTPTLVEMLHLMGRQSGHFQLGSFDQVESQSASLTTFGERLGELLESMPYVPHVL